MQLIYTENQVSTVFLPATHFDNHQIEESYLSVTGWIRDCQKNHESCCLASPTSRPKRLLDLIPPNRDISLRLIETELARNYQYAALSYVWGGPQRMATTTHNIEARSICIEEANLPRTIEDAIRISRKLGIRYLWIDAFCIIQDSENDKKEQLNIMGDIYHGAYITIAAINAHTAEDGFLKTSPLMSWCRTRLPVKSYSTFFFADSVLVFKCK